MLLRVLENAYSKSQMKFENIVLRYSQILRWFNLLTCKGYKPEKGFIGLKCPRYNLVPGWCLSFSNTCVKVILSPDKFGE